MAGGWRRTVWQEGGWEVAKGVERGGYEGRVTFLR